MYNKMFILYVDYLKHNKTVKLPLELWKEDQGLMNFISIYNSYMWPSLITDSPEKSMVSQGLRRFFIEGGAYGTEWPLVMAGSALIIVPVLLLFTFTQKWFINGIGGETGMKG